MMEWDKKNFSRRFPRSFTLNDDLAYLHDGET
jgi:hypothetical protein